MKKATDHIPSHKLAERWFIVDADGKILGRLAVKIARLLMGKDNATFNRAVDAKTNVIVTNAGNIKLSGHKLTDKIYTTHTGYPGGLRVKTPARLLAGRQASMVVINAVAGMLPKNKLRNVMLGRLKVYAGEQHPHAGQQPVAVKF